MSGASTVNILIVDDNDKTRAKLVDQLRYADIRIVGESSFGAAASSWSAGGSPAPWSLAATAGAS